MKIGVAPVNVGTPAPAFLAALAERAEAAGLESLWTYEHAIVPVDYASRYPYARSGKMPVTPETPFVDPLIALAFAAAKTSTIRLATGINILPQANPLSVAKQAASLDFLSGGRFTLGVGVGWLAEEFEAMGTPFARRGARFNDYLAAIRKVWTGDVVEHDGEFVKWSGFKSYPLPAQRPGPPIVIGGTSDPAFRRVARHGDGWFAPNRHIDHLAEMMPRLRAACEAAGRDIAEVEITAMWDPRREAERIGDYADLGVTRLVAQLHMLGADPLSSLDGLAALQS